MQDTWHKNGSSHLPSETIPVHTQFLNFLNRGLSQITNSKQLALVFLRYGVMDLMPSYIISLYSQRGRQMRKYKPWPRDVCICWGRRTGRRHLQSPCRTSLWNCDFPSIGYPESGTVLAPQHKSPSS